MFNMLVGKEVQVYMEDMIMKTYKNLKRPVLDDTVFIEIAEFMKVTVYHDVEDIDKEDSAIMAVKLFQEFLTILKSTEDIPEFLFHRWWDRIYTYLSMYTSDINDNQVEIRMYNRLVNFLKVRENGQDPRAIAGPELLTTVFNRCHEIIKLYQDPSTIQIFKDRLPLYFEKDTLEKQNGGFINARKANAMCNLIQMLDENFEYIPFKTKEDDTYETYVFTDTE